jgi:hypothetical protein
MGGGVDEVCCYIPSPVDMLLFLSLVCYLCKCEHQMACSYYGRMNDSVNTSIFFFYFHNLTNKLITSTKGLGTYE